MKSFYGLLLLGVFLSAAAALHELPKEYAKCKAEDSACIVKRANEILRAYPESFAKLKFEEIEPLTVKSIRFAGDPNTPVNFDLTITDMKIWGLSNITVSKLEGFTKDPKDVKQLLTEGSSPKLTINGKYKISGKLLLLPITGEGDIHVDVKNMQFKYSAKTKSEVRDGKTYLKTDSTKCKSKADGVTMDLKNLFQGQKTLAESTIKVLNDNWQLLWDEMAPQVNDEIRAKITRIMDSFSDHLPYEDMFL